MGLFNIFEPLSTFLWAAWLINLSNIHNFGDRWESNLAQLGPEANVLTIVLCCQQVTERWTMITKTSWSRLRAGSPRESTPRLPHRTRSQRLKKALVSRKSTWCPHPYPLVSWAPSERFNFYLAQMFLLYWTKLIPAILMALIGLSGRSGGP